MPWRRSLDLAAAAFIALFGVAFLLPAQSHAADGEVSRSSAVGGEAEASSPAQIQIVETGSLDSRGAVQLVAQAQGRDCGWEDAPEGARIFCVTGDLEGIEQSIYVTARNQVGRPIPVNVRTVYRYSTSPITALENIDYTPISGTVAIEVGVDQSPPIDVQTLEDALDEFDEIFAIGFEYVEGADLFGSDAYAVMEIWDDDPEPTLTIADDTAAEVDGSLGFVVTLSAVSGKPIAVDYASSDGTATAPGDYGSATGTLTLAAGQTEATISVAIVHDSVIEPDETMTVTLSNAVNVGVSGGSATGTIENSGGVPTASVADVSGVEDAVGNLVFAVTLDTAGVADLTVDYTTSDGTATAGSDYTATSGTLTFAAGEVAKTVSVPVLTDRLPEADEGLTLSLSNVVNGNLGRSTAAGTIRDDDPVLTVAGGAAAEADGTLAFAVTVTGGGSARGTVTVDYATSDGTAMAGSDYTATSGTLTFPPGIGERTLAVPVLDDRVEEGDETVTLTLTGPVNAVIDGVMAVGTILNDDKASTAIALTASPARVSEGAGATSVTVRAMLDDSARSVETRVTVSVSGSGAAEAVDFVSVSDFAVTIAAGAVSGTGTFTLTPEDDFTDEADERLSISGSSNLPVTGTTLTLADDDETRGVVLTVVPSRVSEGAGSTVVTVTATLDGAARTAETGVSVLVSRSGDVDAVDFAEVPDFEIAIAAGATSGTGTFTLEPDDDIVDEADERISIEGTSDLPVTAAALTLADDDTTSSGIVLTAMPSRVSEGAGSAAVTVTAALDGGARTVETGVTVSVSGSGDVDAVDFAAVPDFEIAIAAGATSGTGTFTLEPDDDIVDEADERISIAGTSDLPVTAAALTLADDDTTSSGIVLTAMPSRVSEGAGSAAVTVTAALDGGARTVETGVTVSVSGSGDVDAVDFAAVPDFEIAIAAGATSGTGTFTLDPDDDIVDEADERISIAGTSDLPVTAAALTLADDDTTSSGIVLTAMPSRVSEGAGSAAVTVTAALDGGARTVETGVTVSVSGSGDADAVDFAAVPDFEIAIAAGATSGTGTFTLDPDDDIVDEADERITIVGTSDLPVTAAALTLADDDETSTGILLSVLPASVSEGAGSTVVTVTAALDGGARLVETEVMVSVPGSGDADAVDFAAVPDFEIAIAAGATSGTGTFTLDPDDDIVDEADERITIVGTSDLPVTAAALVLADDDETSTGILLSVLPASVSEGAGSTVVTVTARLDGGARLVETEVMVSVSGSGDADAVDFAEVPDFEIAIVAGATSGTGTFTLDPDDDIVDEADERITIAGTSDLPVTAAALVLADDDETSTGILLSVLPASVSEGAGSTAVTVTATLDGGARTVETGVTVSVSGSGDADAVDFAEVPDFEIAIAAGATSGTGTFTLDPDDDNVLENKETLTVAGTADLEVTAAVIAVTDDDAASTGIALSAAPTRVAEDGGPVRVTVTASLNRAARTVATGVTVSASGSGDAGVVDFAEVPDFEIAIAAGATSGTGTFTLDPDDDIVDEADERITIAGTSDLPVTAAALVLADDDETSTGILLSVLPASVSEGAGSTVVTVTARLDGGARLVETEVVVSVSGSGEADAVDFAAVPDFEIAIAAEATSGTGTFALEPDDDIVDEADERISIAGTSDLPVTAAALVLADDDETSTGILLSVLPASVSEGAGSTVVTVTARVDGGARLVETEVMVSVSGSGDADAVDFAAVPDFEIAIAAGATSGAGGFLLTPEDDTIAEADETLSVSGASDLPVTSTAVTLSNDDEESTRVLMFLSTEPARASEGGGPVRVTVTAQLDGGVRSEATRVVVSVTGSGNPAAVDFAPVANFEITIAAGATSGTGTFTLTPEDDTIAEADEKVSVAGISDLPVTPTVLTLFDDDEASTRILLSADRARVSEGGGPVTVTVTAALDRNSRQQATAVTVTVAGSGNPDAVDFAAVPDFEIAIAAGATSGAGGFLLTPEDDSNFERDETVSVSGASDLPVTSTAVTLSNDDEESTRVLMFLSTEPARASEGGGPVRVTVTAQLDGGVRSEATRVVVSVTGSGNPDAVDFAPVANFEITIAAGATSGTGTFTLTPEDDTIAEADEKVSVAGISDLPVTPTALTVFDDDEASTRILLSADRARVSEGGGPVTVTVTAALDRNSRQQATAVTVSVAGSGNPDAVDFAAVPDFEIAIATGAMSGTGTFTVNPDDDAIAEADETLTVSGISELPVTATSLTLADDDERPQQTFRVLLFESAANPVRQGFLRVINHSRESGEVRIDAVDDGGARRAPIILAIEGGEAVHFNSDDLENGNADKGLSGGVGPSSRGEWRLKLSSDLDIEVLAYARTTDGFVTTMHDSAPVKDGTHRVSFFNPGRNMDQMSLLRLVNTGAGDVEATISGTDDAGVASGEVRVEILVGTVLTLSAAELESGIAEGIVAGALGVGTGKWRLTVSSSLPLAVKSLLTSPPGYLANLSTSPRTPGSAVEMHGVALFPSMSAPDWKGVVRVVNRSPAAGEVRIVAMDDTAFAYEPLTLTVGAGGAAHFNSADLELGNADRGLSGSTGAGVGSWRLDLTSALDIVVLSYVRSVDGFLTPVHDLAPVVDGAYRVAFFNPASNDRQVSRLRLINAGTSNASVTVTGVDDAGRSPGSAVRLKVAAGTALEVSSGALESGTGGGIEGGALGDGEGKWRLRVVSDRPIRVMSLLDSPTGHLTNLSTALDGVGGAP